MWAVLLASAVTSNHNQYVVSGSRSRPSPAAVNWTDAALLGRLPCCVSAPTRPEGSSSGRPGVFDDRTLTV